MARQQLGVAPSNAADAATKTYVDTWDMLPNTGVPVGWYIGPSGVYTTGVQSHTTGVWCYSPIWVGYGGGTFDAFVSNLGTARAGGTATATIFALHPDDNTGYPDSGTVLASATVVVTTTGKVISTFASTQVLNHGLYWIGSLYYAGTTAPTTAEQFSGISGQIMNVPLSPTITVGSSIRGLRSSAATYTGLPGSKITAANMITQTNTGSHYVMLRRSA